VDSNNMQHEFIIKCYNYLEVDRYIFLNVILI